jgi:hypothetical protein
MDTRLSFLLLQVYVISCVVEWDGDVVSIGVLQVVRNRDKLVWN